MWRMQIQVSKNMPGMHTSSSKCQMWKYVFKYKCTFNCSRIRFRILETKQKRGLSHDCFPSTWHQTCSGSFLLLWQNTLTKSSLEMVRFIWHRATAEWKSRQEPVHLQWRAEKMNTGALLACLPSAPTMISPCLYNSWELYLLGNGAAHGRLVLLTSVNNQDHPTPSCPLANLI